MYCQPQFSVRLAPLSGRIAGAKVADSANPCEPDRRLAFGRQVMIKVKHRDQHAAYETCTACTRDHLRRSMRKQRTGRREDQEQHRVVRRLEADGKNTCASSPLSGDHDDLGVKWSRDPAAVIDGRDRALMSAKRGVDDWM